MFKERVKTSIIIILILNLFFLTGQMWFRSGILGPDWPNLSFSDLPFASIFSRDDSVSVPKENLSKARKVVINDGGFWYPYYNTDEAFDTLNEKAGDILKSVLSGKAKKEVKITYDVWRGYLNSPSMYVQYPIKVTPEMLAMVLNASYERLNGDIGSIQDVIIIPESETSVRVALRDADTNLAREYYVNDENLSFPMEVLSMYTTKYPRDGYYEFAFSALMGQMVLGGNVTVSDLVLFSDNDSTYRDIHVSNPLEGREYDNILKSFSFSPNPLRHYSDDFGAENYIENYATVRILPEGYVEYMAVQNDKGIDLNVEGENQYEDLNAVIDFAEKVWNSVSDEPLNVLVSGIEKTENGNIFTFDYYYGGREIALGVMPSGVDKLNHAIEVETFEGKIISYRQFMRRYSETGSVTSQENFTVALDYFVQLFKNTPDSTITDLYPGYYDRGVNQGILKTTWIGELNNYHEKYPKR